MGAAWGGLLSPEEVERERGRTNIPLSTTIGAFGEQRQEIKITPTRSSSSSFSFCPSQIVRMVEKKKKHKRV